MSQAQTLEPLTFPLHGQRLIEASAGTGKTWTIAALYLRLVLGHGAAQAFPRPLLPPQILVVTFTNAATRELRDRIRARLAEAARAFSGQLAAERIDPYLAALLAEPEYADPVARNRAAQQLDQAAQWMDEAAIHTIHGWSQRMLSQHAFASGSLFNQVLDNDDSELRAEVVRDYWRTFCLSLPAPAARELGSLAAEPAALESKVAPLLAHPETELRYEGQPIAAALSPALFAQQLLQWQGARQVLEQDARRLWREEVDAIEAAISAAIADGKLSKGRFRPADTPAQLEQMRRWSEGEEAADGKLLGRFTQNRLREGTNKKYQFEGTPSHPAFELLERLEACEAQRPNLNPLLRHAALWIGERLERTRLKAARLGFDDLLRRLGAALAGEGGAQLAQQIRAQYPVALIDEFQDTDPLQYASFRRIYGAEAVSAMDTEDAVTAVTAVTAVAGVDSLAAADPASLPAATTSALLMIGDPKQAIYAFRGADIHTYLQARRDCGERLYTLGTNYRSSTALVGAVNRMFEAAEASQPQGAFGFARGDSNPLPFQGVRAHGSRRVLEIDGVTPEALQCWWLEAEDVPNKAQFRAQAAARSASEICRLLTLAQQGRAGLRDAAGQLTPLRPADIAVLVRTGSEARWIRQALEQRQVRSVYLSDRESVFTTQEAHDLWRWLRACAEPEQSRLLHAALATHTLGLTLAQLDRLNQDEQAWEAQVERFRELRDCWQRQGVLAMLRRLLDRFELPARLLQRVEGERVLTNLLHLAELLQVAAQQLDGELALIRHLGELLQEQGSESEERVVRLESDADRVQVITIHKSKGLEYPLVFLPFISDCRVVDGKAGSYRYHDEDGQPLLELNSRDEEAKARADRERLLEDLRLLYVALTRPVHACWLLLAPIRELSRSAIGQLLDGPSVQADSLYARLQALCAPGEIAVLPAPPADSALLPPEQQEAALEAARSCAQPAVTEPWWIASYSALRQRGQASTGASGESGNAAADAGAEETASAANLLESRDEQAGGEPLGQPGGDEVLLGPHRFPKGASAGTFLHSLLEWAAGEGFARVATDAGLRGEYLQRQCQSGWWQGWQVVLDSWLVQLLSTPLPLTPALSAPARSAADSEAHTASPTEIDSDAHNGTCDSTLNGPGTGNSTASTDAESRLRLADLSQPRAELEFWFPARQVAVEQLDRLVCKYLLAGHPRPALEPMQLNGMLKGFIDLIFEHQGRYWVADYKSNWLGPDATAYSEDAMREAILHKRYDMQYALYTLALHRLLQARLPDYAADPRAGYERYVGGALYLFLRGIGEPQRCGAFVERPPVALILALDALFAGAPLVLDPAVPDEVTREVQDA